MNMKTFISLLSILTISETAIPFLNIDADPYQNENQNNLKNNEINILKRNKRYNNKPIIINSYQSTNSTPIRSFVGFSRYESMWANWSSTIKYNNYTCPYLVVDYKDYAETFDEFVEKYPTVTIDTNGEAVSSSTFGDKGAGQFGKKHFETKEFNKSDDARVINFINIVDAYDTVVFSYVINVKIGIGFKKFQSQLYLIPFIDGSLYSVGAYTRYVDFGLDVYSITFNPEYLK